MKLHNTNQNEAILSNVGQVGEFRIRNSAKAFNILSSGLYANKIRAIIRELSCNAVDSHAAAGRTDTPFDVHLPTAIEPHFSIRDYGTGLTHDEVTNIYTTYFESTKTDSNDYIGALGLGSKSPFSYTDNFTVTAVKNGRKGVYTAFINDAGVPSIALMAEEATTDPSGVEIKFGVQDRWDFEKFRSEARMVYTYFKLRPVVSGPNFEFRDIEYESRDIVPGVHAVTDSNSSRAVMGNIAYPIDMPSPKENLGELAELLSCGLEMHFAIGELDFQASREGLSYIPETIAAIRRKLTAVNTQLAKTIAVEADAIANKWERAEFLLKKANTHLWKAAVGKYVADSKFKLVSFNGNYLTRFEFKHQVSMLAQQFNVSIIGFHKSAGSNVCSNTKANTVAVKRGKETEYRSAWNIPVDPNLFFVINDTRVGAVERAKYHWRNGGAPVRNGKTRYNNDTVLVLSPVDRTRPMRTREFFASLRNPPESQILVASTLKEKPRKASANSLGANVTIMSLQRRGYGGYHREREMVWKDAGQATDFDATKTYYYLPLTGFNVISNGVHIHDVKEFHDNIVDSGVMSTASDGFTIYGVRKTDHKWVAAQKNWVNIQDHLRGILAKVDVKTVHRFAVRELDLNRIFSYNESILKQISVDSQFAQFVSQTKGHKEGKASRHSFEKLCRDYSTGVDIDGAVKGLRDEYTAIRTRYPLLCGLKDYDIDSAAVAEYINLIDSKGVK